MTKSLFILLALLSTTSLAGQLSSTELLDKSIEFHDPKGLLINGKATLQFDEKRPDGSIRKSSAILHPRGEYYQIIRSNDGIATKMISDKGNAIFYLNDSKDYSEEDAKKHRLNEERLAMMSSYYRYLWHLPMTLKDSGTIIDPSVKSKDFFGKQCLEIKVTYDPEVGSDIWYFYFSPNTYALEGYRFYHDESINDGEYILISELENYKSVRVPKVRKWYTHKEGKFLGTDVLANLKIE